jgi:hypothetical protein
VEGAWRCVEGAWRVAADEKEKREKKEKRANAGGIASGAEQTKGKRGER